MGCTTWYQDNHSLFNKNIMVSTNHLTLILSGHPVGMRDTLVGKKKKKNTTFNRAWCLRGSVGGGMSSILVQITPKVNYKPWQRIWRRSTQFPWGGDIRTETKRRSERDWGCGVSEVSRQSNECVKSHDLPGRESQATDWEPAVRIHAFMASFVWNWLQTKWKSQ